MAKPQPWSGGAFVDVMEPIQHRAWPDRAGHWARPRLGCLQAERATRPVPVVVGDEFAKHRQEVMLVEDDQVVETLAAECPDDTFGDRVRQRRSNGCRDASH